MCITLYSAMDNAIHSIWKSKGSFPTSCKQRCPQLHKTESYTHYTQCRRLRNPTPSFFPFYISQKKFLQTRPFSGKIILKISKKIGVPKHPYSPKPSCKIRSVGL